MTAIVFDAPAVIRHLMFVPVALVALFNRLEILRKELFLFITCSSKIFGELIK
ncbi:hypothetical protein AVEN_256496-1, partial [Araneus ventricosus]